MGNRTEPTLTAKGWLMDGDVAERLDAALANVFVADKSQSVSYNNIVSVQWIISEHGDSKLDLQATLQATLTAFLNAKFDSAEVTIEIKEADNSSQWDILMSGYVTNNGAKASISKLLQVKNGVLVHTFDTLNKGAA